MKTSDFLIGILAMGFMILTYMHLTLTKEVRDGYQKSYSSLVKDSTFKATITKKLASLDKKDSVIAETIVYLDSCNQVKATKVERAEKRGRFIGGLLRGLFPGI